MKLSTRAAFITATLLGAFAFVGGTGLTVSSAWLITMAAQHPPILVLGVAIVMVRFFGIFRSLARYGERVVSHEAIFKKLTGIRVQLFASIANRLEENSTLIARESKAIIDDVERAQEFHLRVTLPGFSAMIAGTITILISAWIDPVLLLVSLPATLILGAVIPFAVHTYLDPIAVQIEDSENEYSEYISSASHALVEAKVFGYSESYLSGLSKSSERLNHLEVSLYRRTSLLQFLTIGAIGTSLLATVYLIQQDSEAIAIHIAMAIFLALVGFEGFTTWFPNLFVAGKNRRAAETVDELAGKKVRERQMDAIPSSAELVVRDLIPFWSEKFLKPSSFSLSSGEVLLITGPSGIGKSTLAASILGFTHYDGSIQIGGVELRDIGNLAEFVSGTLQRGHIFNTTLRENLKIANTNLTDAELLEILTELELNAISLDEVLGEFGRPISGGEAKRLSIARALLSSAPILILDEPLEHLDHERAGRIQDSILKRCRNRALIVITHSPWLQYSRKLELARE